jgi:diguanylate cyclase (GGDEF)-like protein
MGDFKEALAFHKSYKEKSDALFQSEKQKMATELNAKYESEQKEKEILLLNKDNQIKTDELRLEKYQRNIVLIIAVSVILVALLIVQRLYASRKTNIRLEKLNKKLNELSLRDTLTGLYNRRYFHSHIHSHLSYAMRRDEEKKNNTGKIGFLVIDVDHFKLVNDREGHHTGDLVLKEFGKRLTELLRGSDIVVRWGGEEFLVAVRDATMEGIKQLAERILQRIGSEPFSLEGKTLQITCSVGHCCFPFSKNGDPLDWEKVVRLADLALYKAKEAGRNLAFGVLPGENPVSEDKIEIILKQFDQALEQNLIRIY